MHCLRTACGIPLLVCVCVQWRQITNQFLNIYTHDGQCILSFSLSLSVCLMALSCFSLDFVCASLYKCKNMSRHSDQKETEKRCQRDLSVPSSKCRRRHNILYTHIIHFVYPRYLLLPLLLSLCDRSFFIKTFFFSPLSLPVFRCSFFVLGGPLSFCRTIRLGKKFLRFSHKMWMY